jgi:hypothetical protein
MFSVRFKPLFGKEGKGRFFAEAGRNYVANFWVTTLALDTPRLRRCPALFFCETGLDFNLYGFIPRSLLRKVNQQSEVRHSRMF